MENHPEFLNKKIEDILKDLNSVPEGARNAVRNHGGGHFNHSLFWKILTNDKDKNKFKGKIADKIKEDFGSFDSFKEKFNECALNRFGSGWAWLVLKNRKLEVMSTSNQDSPLMEGAIPLLGLDVWEHAYYLKWQSNRKGYIEGFWNLVNWQQVEKNFVDKF